LSAYDLRRSVTSIAYWPTVDDYANLPVLPFACVDIGSNTTRLLVAEMDGGRITELAAVREFTLLGSAATADHSLPEPKIVETAEAVAAQVDTARRLGARLIEIVGTAVLRSAPNAHALGAEIERLTGFPLRVLSEEAEAELSFLGATSVSELEGNGPVAVADVGGGSSELAVGTPCHKPSWWHSLEIGSARLARETLFSDPPASGELAACRDRAAAVVRALRPPAVDAALAVGGSATSLLVLAGPRLDDRALERALHLMGQACAADLARDYEIDIRRVKLLPAGIAILAAVSGLLGVPLQVARGGLREGVVMRLAESASA
jgi:exopolyphosphatase/guanosine-5'-triphosphate,3'-diphosphate pyrophosphatase